MTESKPDDRSREELHERLASLQASFDRLAAEQRAARFPPWAVLVGLAIAVWPVVGAWIYCCPRPAATVSVRGEPAPAGAGPVERGDASLDELREELLARFEQLEVRLARLERRLARAAPATAPPPTAAAPSREALRPSEFAADEPGVRGVPFAAEAGQAVMYAHFIDVGQADAALLEFPCGAILIDAGAQDSEHADRLIAYLNAFFDARPDLDRTLASVIITHNHIDHTRALRSVVESFTVQRYIDNGQIDGAIGTGDPRWVRMNATTGGRNIVIREILDPDVRAAPDGRGLTDGDIDPLTCEVCDPSIVVLSGQVMDEAELPPGAFDNKNNHSIVIRVDFGESSFLFTGDLEEPAIERLIGLYGPSGLLDVDVYQVGHHGSHNGTTLELVDAMTPDVAVFSVGRWDFGRNPSRPFSTFAYGHPRRVVVELLHTAIPGTRSTPIDAMVAERARDFSDFHVRKRMYATGWDGTVKIRATPAGRFRTTLGH